MHLKLRWPRGLSRAVFSKPPASQKSVNLTYIITMTSLKTYNLRIHRYVDKIDRVALRVDAILCGSCLISAPLTGS